MRNASLNAAFVISSRAMAGMELRVARMARLLTARGHRIHFGCPPGSLLDNLLAEYGVRRFPLYIHGSLDLVACGRLVRQVRRHGIDLIMAFNGKDYWMTTLAAALTGRPIVINRSTSNAVNRLTVPLMKRADAIVAVSRGIKEVLTGQGMSDGLVQVVYLGVNTSVFSPEACPSKEEVRDRLGLPREAFIVGCFGRSGKGQRLLFEADDHLGNTREKVHYFFAGEFIPERLGPEAAQKAALDGRVHLRDLIPYEEVPACLKALDLIVMLPEREPFSNAVLEAMAMETPVILSRTLGNLEAVEDGVSGILVDRDDLPVLAGHIRSLAESPARCGEMGRAAGARVRERFTEEVMLDETEEVWRKALGGAALC